jgi:hypothetical protein
MWKQRERGSVSGLQLGSIADGGIEWTSAARSLRETEWRDLKREFAASHTKSTHQTDRQQWHGWKLSAEQPRVEQSGEVVVKRNHTKQQILNQWVTSEHAQKWVSDNTLKESEWSSRRQWCAWQRGWVQKIQQMRECTAKQKKQRGGTKDREAWCTSKVQWHWTERQSMSWEWAKGFRKVWHWKVRHGRHEAKKGNGEATREKRECDRLKTEQEREREWKIMTNVSTIAVISGNRGQMRSEEENDMAGVQAPTSEQEKKLGTR